MAPKSAPLGGLARARLGPRVATRVRRGEKLVKIRFLGVGQAWHLRFLVDGFCQGVLTGYEWLVLDSRHSLKFGYRSDDRNTPDARC